MAQDDPCFINVRFAGEAGCSTDLKSKRIGSCVTGRSHEAVA